MDEEWFTILDTNYDGIRQGITVSKNPKDYVKTIKQEEEEQVNRNIPFADPNIIIPNKVKLNDVTEITNRFRNSHRRKK